MSGSHARKYGAKVLIIDAHEWIMNIQDKGDLNMKEADKSHL